VDETCDPTDCSEMLFADATIDSAGLLAGGDDVVCAALLAGGGALATCGGSACVGAGSGAVAVSFAWLAIFSGAAV
jgi:hypothetical protein